MKLLIIRPGALGDTLMLMPAISLLRASTEIVLAARAPGLHILRPYVREAIDFEGPGWSHLYRDDPGRISLPPVDRAVAFLSDPEGLVAGNLRSQFPSGAFSLYPPFPPVKARVHVAHYVAQALERAGLPLDATDAVKKAENQAIIITKPGPAGYEVVLHPGSGSPKKNFPPEVWVRLTREMILTYPEKRTLILLGPAEEHLLAFYRDEFSDDDVSLCFAPDHEELQALLRGARLYVGHDSGVTHLSAMLGTRTIALFKNSSIAQWRPLGPSVTVIGAGDSGPAPFDQVMRAATEWLNRGFAGQSKAPS